MTAPRAQAQAPSGELAAALADPDVEHSLTVILEHADLLAMMVESVSELLARGDDLLDVGMELAGELRTTIVNAPVLKDPSTAQLLDSGRRLAATLPSVAPAVVAAAESGTIEALANSDLLSPRAVDQISLLARGVVRGAEVHATDPPKTGNPIALVKLLRDPDVAAAISYFACVAKALGQELRTPAPAAPDPTPSATTPTAPSAAK